jgi:enoyl-CoA hydratase/carnithine racemase
MNFEDILYEVRNGVAWITINRAGQDERLSAAPPATRSSRR